MPETPESPALPPFPIADRPDAIPVAPAGATVADWVAAKLAMHVLADLTAEVPAEARERTEPTEAASP